MSVPGQRGQDSRPRPARNAPQGRSQAELEAKRPTAELRPHHRGDLVPEMAKEHYAGFLRDVAERGLLTPLEITEDGVVLDGKERLRAAHELGLEQVPVRVVSPADEPEYIVLCALSRRHLSASQRAALVLELEGYRALKEEGESRRLANLRQAPEVAALPPRGKTRDQAADWADVSPRTLQDAATVRANDPELFARVKAGGLAANVAARRVRRALRDTTLPSPPPLPSGPFELIYADPPWQLGNPDSLHAPENHYPTMPLEEIKALSPPATESACLFLWAVNCLLPEALELIEAWGFSYRTNLVWVKPSIGLGYWARNRHELLLFAKRGEFAPPDPDLVPDSVLEAPRARHSAKPAAVYELIERAYPELSKLELFARGSARPGWAAWGNEAEAA